VTVRSERDVAMTMPLDKGVEPITSLLRKRLFPDDPSLNSNLQAVATMVSLPVDVTYEHEAI
jgi:hypothetical protein